MSTTFVNGLIQSAVSSIKSGSPGTLCRMAFGGSYTYSVRNPLMICEQPREDAQHYLARLSFQKRGEEQFGGLFIRPRAEGVYPCALLLHALSSDKETMIHHFGRVLADRGFAALALDAHLHGERRTSRTAPLGPIEYLSLVRESIIEYRQALDYLQTRDDVDFQRTGLLGYSLGAMMGSVLTGVDKRVKCCVLMVGGDLIREHLSRVPAALRGLLDSISPASFAPKISPRPVLFINGTRDHVVPRSAAEILHAAAQEPKEVVWADADHILPPEVALRGVDWLEQRLA